MKKLTSVLCALAIALGISAAPLTKQIPNGGQFVKKAKKEMTVKTPVKKLAAESVNFAKFAKAPQIRKATNNVTITAFSEQAYAGGELYVVLYDETNGVYFIFDVTVESGAEHLELNHTYSMAEAFDTYYCYWEDAYDYADYTDFTLTKSLNLDGTVHVQATIVDENDDVWNLTYDEPVIPEGGSFSTDNIEANYYASTSDIQYILTFADDNLKASFDILLPVGDEDVVAGTTYTLADMDAEYTWLSYAHVDVAITSASFTKVVNLDGSYDIVASMLDENGSTWTLTAHKAAPVEITININKGLEFVDHVADQGWWQVTGSNEDFFVTLSNNSNTAIAGTYDMADMDPNYTYARDLATSTKISFVSGSVTVTVNVDESIDFVGSFEDKDGNTFILNLHYVAPKPEAEVAVIADADIIEFGGACFVQATDENEVEVSLYIIGSLVDGAAFTAADLNLNYSAVFDDEESQSVFTANLAVAVDGDVTTISGSILCYNNTNYTILLTYTAPQPMDIDITASIGLSFDDQVEAEGWWQVYGSNDDFAFSLSNISTTEIAGTYDMSEMDADWSYVADIATPDDKITFVSGSVVVTVNADESIDFVGSFVGQDGNNYIFNLHYADPTAEVEKTVAINDAALDDSGASFGLYGISGKDENNIFVQLYIFIEELMPGVPRTEYTEDDLYQNYSGISDDGLFANIFSAEMNFSLSGTDIVMVADILCNNNTLYHVSMVVPDIVPTGVENVSIENNEVVKAIRNGQFIIKMNDIEFNANGARVK